LNVESARGVTGTGAIMIGGKHEFSRATGVSVTAGTGANLISVCKGVVDKCKKYSKGKKKL
tara:strand:+ start:216 stop:398 length:183 start_codon:yes stop_codon:yes gene_type:complete